MDIPLNNDRYYCCNICNKDYSSYKSLWNHNRKFHYNNVSNNIPIVSNNIPIVSNNKNTCKYCYKVYSSPQNRWKH